MRRHASSVTIQCVASRPRPIPMLLAEMRSMRFIVRMFVIGIVLLDAPFFVNTALADPLAKPASTEARSHLTLGNKLYGVRSFDEAAAEYKAGALIEPAPVFDYNLGQCFRQLGKYQEAIWHYNRFLTRGNPEGQLLDAVNGFIAQMRSELDRRAMTQPPTDPAPPMPVAPVSRVRSQAEHPVMTSDDAWYRDSVGWGLTGAGLVGVAVGGWLFSDGAKLDDEANVTLSQQERHQLRDKASTRNLFGTIIGLGGTGLLTAGIIKLVVHHGQHTSVAEWSVTASPTGVMVFGQF
jgi:hypothetical protein